MTRLFTTVSLTLMVVAGGLLSPAATRLASASRLANDRVVFDSALELLEVAPLPNSQGLERYRLVIQVPPSAGEPLEALVVAPRSRQASVTFDLQATEAYLSSARGPGQTIPLASVGGSPSDLNQVLVVFEQPVVPGSQVTVVLTAQTTPTSPSDEVGVTAYPVGDDSIGQFLGYRQIAGEPSYPTN